MYGFGNLERKSVLSPKKKKRKYSVDNNNLSTGANSSQSSNNKPNSASLNANKTINIIDRVLDLSKYDRNTGLYTLSREWINATTSVSDKANSRKLSTPMEVEESKTKSGQESSFYVTELPGPIKVENQICTKQVNENIKENIRSSEANDMDLIKSLNVDEIMQTHALLKLHVNRWKQARKEWVNYYNNTNVPYKNSYDTLKSIYEEF